MSYLEREPSVTSAIAGTTLAKLVRSYILHLLFHEDIVSNEKFYQDLQYQNHHIHNQEFGNTMIYNITALKTKTFPWKLHAMLNLAEREGFGGVVSWLPDGKSFKVHKPDSFVKTIMPNFFHQSKYKSFQRQCKYFMGICNAPSPASLQSFPGSNIVIHSYHRNRP